MYVTTSDGELFINWSNIVICIWYCYFYCHCYLLLLEGCNIFTTMQRMSQRTELLDIRGKHFNSFKVIHNSFNSCWNLVTTSCRFSDVILEGMINRKILGRIILEFFYQIVNIVCCEYTEMKLLTKGYVENCFELFKRLVTPKYHHAKPISFFD